MNSKLKKILAAALCATCLLSGFTVPAIASENAKVKGEGINMRDKPVLAGEVVAVVDQNCPIEVKGETENWYQIETYGKTGFVKKEYIEFTGEVQKLEGLEVEKTENNSEQGENKENKTAENEATKSENTEGTKAEGQKPEESKTETIKKPKVEEKTDTSANLLKPGTRSAQVSTLQKQLKELGYLTQEPTGYYGYLTDIAVREFQDGNGLAVDGVVGNDVKNLLSSGKAVRKADIKPKIQMLNVQKLPWSEMRNIYSKGTEATVVDLNTGERFQVKHLYGTNHADSEPMSAKDTAIMKNIYGGSWSWSRRPIVIIVNGNAYAASMNGMPHGGKSVGGNGFNGHFCIHFAGSKTHGSGRVDGQHQSAINTAASVGSIPL